MPSLLTTPRMSPELRARVIRSLHSDARSRAGGASPLVGARLVRLLVAFGVIALGIALGFTFKKSRAEFSSAKKSLISAYARKTTAFDEDYEARLHFIDELLKGAHEPHAPDFVDPTLTRDLKALDQRLEAPFVFVRGPTNGFRRQEKRRSTWHDGGPGAFIRCFIEPPTSRTESKLLRHLGRVYEPSAFRSRFVNIDEAFRALAFVRSDFEPRLRSVRMMRELSSLRAQLETAPLEGGKRFAQVKTFAYVFDEPKVKGTVSDFDGEAEHFMRIGFVDLTTKKHLLRLRRRVDPEWISEKSRLSYSRQLDSCRLALDVRKEFEEKDASAPSDGK